MPFKANNNREAVVVCARHVVKRPGKRSVLVYFNCVLMFSKNLSGRTVFSKYYIFHSKLSGSEKLSGLIIEHKKPYCYFSNHHVILSSHQN